MKANKGFTLIELVLSITAFGAVMLLLTGLLGIVMSTRVKNQAQQEVDEAGSIAMERMLQVIRNAQSVTTPVPGMSANSLAVVVDDALKSPTVFDASGTYLRVTEGATLPMVLTSSRVAVSGLTFRNLAFPGSPGMIRIEFTLSHLNPGSRPEYLVSKTFYGSASVR